MAGSAKAVNVVNVQVPAVPRVPPPANGAAPPQRGTLPKSTPIGSGRKPALLASAALVAALGLVAAGFALLPQDAPEPTRLVVLYVTDLPGRLERVEFTLKSATLGQDYPLLLERPRIEISAHVGPENAVRVAHALVPARAEGDLHLTFEGARGYRDGAWFALDLPEDGLSVAQAVDAARETAAALLDFDLDSSLHAEGDRVSFRPYVKSLLRYAGDETEPELARVVEAAARVDDPPQQRIAMLATEPDRVVANQIQSYPIVTSSGTTAETTCAVACIANSASTSSPSTSSGLTTSSTSTSTSSDGGNLVTTTTSTTSTTTTTTSSSSTTTSSTSTKTEDTTTKETTETTKPALRLLP
jgi:hypothetical protein